MEYAYLRKIPGALLGSLITSMTSIPFELAKNAYYGDKTFPK
jgi:solute carrier family 25 oxoglutarate transporter 11